MQIQFHTHKPLVVTATGDVSHTIGAKVLLQAHSRLEILREKYEVTVTLDAAIVATRQKVVVTLPLVDSRVYRLKLPHSDLVVPDGKLFPEPKDVPDLEVDHNLHLVRIESNGYENLVLGAIKFWMPHVRGHEPLYVLLGIDKP